MHARGIKFIGINVRGTCLITNIYTHKNYTCYTVILLNHACRVYHVNVYCYFFIQELDLAILEDLAEKVRTCTYCDVCTYMYMCGCGYWYVRTRNADFMLRMFTVSVSNA